MSERLSCFKAYDIRGQVPQTLNAAISKATGAALARLLSARSVVVGRDVRLSGEELCAALTEGLASEGVSVTNIGLCGTEEIYHATATQPFDAGIMITGSHNPADENGMKIVRANAIPLSGDSGLNALKEETARLLQSSPPLQTGTVSHHSASFRDAYIRFLLDTTQITSVNTRPLKIHADPGNGCAGLVLRELAPHLPFDFSFSHMEPDGTFPHGIPNPLLPEKRAATAQAVRDNNADMGIAWDGDFDRCFFYDHEGNFIEGYYLVGLLAQSILTRFPGAKIIHDPRLIWNTREIVLQAGGLPIVSKTGHAFIKERMRAEDAVYGGEMSAHHYFRDFAYCDSGMLPWLLVARLLIQTGKTLAELVATRMQAYPCSGEINRKVVDTQAVITHMEHTFRADALQIDHIDGLSVEFAQWRFNVRASNTEALLRLNVESRADVALMREKTDALLRIIDTYAS